MKTWTAAALALLCGAGLSMASENGHPHHGNPEGDMAQPHILTFDQMYAVDGPLLGDANAIRGIIGDELPWRIARFIKGRLDKDGRLKILVRGLVFADDPLVPPDLVGKNDEPDYRGAVSCLTEDGLGGIVPATVVTSGFPATPLGDSFIDETLILPNPCIAPIVFVLAGSEDKWFAVTGFESVPDHVEHTGDRGSMPRH